jgi:hypothetical protein
MGGVIRAGRLLGGNRSLSPAIAFSVDNQSFTRGDLTLTNAAPYTFSSSAGTIESIGTKSGTNNADWTVSLAAGVVTVKPAGDGVANGPYSITVPCYPEAAQGGDVDNVVLTITTEANTYTVSTESELTATITDIGTASSSEITVKILASELVWSDTDWNGKTFTNTVTIRSVQDSTLDTWYTKFTGECTVRDTNNILFQHLEFEKTGLTLAWEHVLDLNNSDDIAINRCYLHADYRDPNGDYSTSGSYVNGSLLHFRGGSADPVITENLFSDGHNCITGFPDSSINISHNRFKRWYEDAIQLGAVTAQGSGSLLTGTTTIEWNTFTQAIGFGTDADNPHPDIMQFLANTDGDWEGHQINGNRYWKGDSRSGEVQAVFCNSIASTYYFVDPVFKGNVFLSEGINNGIKYSRYNGGLWVNNTVCGYDDTGGSIYSIGNDTGGIENNIGVQKVYGNITEAFAWPGGGTQDEQDNIVLGTDGATISYDAVFDGPSYAPLTLAETMAKFSMKTGGSADNTINSGAIGSGYVTWPTVEGRDGGQSFDSAFESRADTTDPVFDSSTPSDNAVDIAIAATVTIQFTDINAISFGTTKTFTIYDVTNTGDFEVFSTATDVGSGAGKMSIAAGAVLLEPTSSFANSTEYAVKWVEGAVKDASGNEVSANATNTLVSFTTVASSAVNIASNTNDFTTGWNGAGAGAVVTANTRTNPLGGGSADRLDDQTANADGRELEITVPNDSDPYIASVYVYAGTSSDVGLIFRLVNGTSITYYTTYDLSVPEVSDTLGTGAAGITDVGGGWYRIVAAITNNSTGNTLLKLAVYPSKTNVYDTASTGTAEFCNVMVEQKSGTTPSAYVDP